MKSNIDNSSSATSALSSVLEVAGFACSLLELLLTRILPLLGFLIAHFLLHCCRLLASIFVLPSRAGHLKAANLADEEQRHLQRRLRSAYDEQQQSYGDVKLLKRTSPSLFAEDILNNFELQTQPQPSAAAAAQAAIAASPASKDLFPQSHHLKTSDAQPTSDVSAFDSLGGQSSIAAETVHVALSAPSDEEAAIHDGLKQQEEQPSDLQKIEKSASPLLTTINEEIHVDANALNGEHVDESSTLEMKRHPFTRVLPPSLSQIKRTLMQRSRGASASSPLKPLPQI
ncbi:hypothetical protein L7F22_032472 [Adiantum nelumboides]|nr:hypothetical protein [Adiantum nelumboides]